MSSRLLWALGLILTLTLACSPPPTSVGTGNVSSTTAPVAAAGQPRSVDLAYSLVLAHSVDPVSSSTLAKAGLKGIQYALEGAGLITAQVPVPQFGTDPNQNLVLFDRAYDQATSRYGSKLNRQAMSNAAMTAMANSVQDCHTTYFPPAQFQEELAALRGETKFGGIGASLRKPKTGDPLVIWRVFAHTPAAQAGLQPGDTILAVDGHSVKDASLQQAVDFIRGPIGSALILQIQATRSGQTENVRVVRAEITPPEIESRLLPGNIGYVEIYGFPDNVAGNLQKALDGFDRSKTKGWIFDLRNNGGGALSAETQTLSLFIKNKNKVLFYVWDRNGQRTNFKADGSARGNIPPIVVLVNDGTGSGAEIFAAVLREFGLARIVGTQTAGCVGTGQLFNLPNGGGIQVTVGQLLTGQGNKVLNRVGVTPDETVTMSSQDLVTGRDPQLAAAEQLLQKR